LAEKRWRGKERGRVGGGGAVAGKGKESPPDSVRQSKAENCSSQRSHGCEAERKQNSYPGHKGAVGVSVHDGVYQEPNEKQTEQTGKVGRGINKKGIGSQLSPSGNQQQQQSGGDAEHNAKRGQNDAQDDGHTGNSIPKRCELLCNFSS